MKRKFKILHKEFGQSAKDEDKVETFVRHCETAVKDLRDMRDHGVPAHLKAGILGALNNLKTIGQIALISCVEDNSSKRLLEISKKTGRIIDVISEIENDRDLGVRFPEGDKFLKILER